MKTILLLHYNEKSLGSLLTLEIPNCPTKEISEICLVVDLNGYLPNVYPKKWKNVPIKIFECTGDSYRNIVDYLIHVETIYFTNNFDKFLIPILRSLPNIYGFTFYGEITIHEIFYELYAILSRYFSKVQQKSIKIHVASDSTNIYNEINNLSKEHWHQNQFFEIDSDNDDLIDIFIKKLKPKVNSVFKEIDWYQAIKLIGGRKNFNFFYLEDHFNTVTELPRTFIIKNYNRISEPYKSEIISVIKSHIKPEQKIIFFRESFSTDNPFPTFKISLIKLGRIRNTDSEIKLFVFMILEAEMEGQQRELRIRSNSDLVNNILVSSELLAYGPAVIIDAIKKILSASSTTTIDLSTIDFWYELFNNLPVKNKMIYKNLIKNLFSDETGTPAIIEPTNNLIYPEYPNRIERKGKIVKIFFNNVDIDFVGSRLVGWKYLEFLIIKSNNGITYTPLDLYYIINKGKLSRTRGTTNSSDKELDTINDDHKAIEYIDKKTLKESIERIKPVSYTHLTLPTIRLV